MALIVQKYGGTSVGSTELIAQVAERVSGYLARGHQVAVVVSAMLGETNRLVAMGHELGGPAASRREMDVLTSSGEQVTIALLSIALLQRGVAAKSFLADQIALHTDGAHGRARIERIDTEALRSEIAAGVVPVIAGFQGVNDLGEITTLGRGGSDTSAVALAAAVNAAECQIYTDVDGVYTTDPRVVDGAKRLDSITFEEMLEMASMGSKVLHLRSVEFAGKYGIPVRVLSSFKDGPGTLISVDEDNLMEAPTIAGIAFNRDEAKLTMVGVPDTPGIAYQILGPIGEANIEVDVILQNVGDEGKTDFTFTVSRNDLSRAEAILETHISELGAMEWRSDSKIAKVSVVGVGMRSHAGVAATMFRALSEVGVNMQMISTSEIKISVIIEEKFLELAVRALHSAFGLDAEEAGDTDV